MVKTYRTIAIELRARLSEETWAVLLKVFMGVADQVLKDPKETVVLSGKESARERAAFELAENSFVPSLIEAMFEIWLVSGTQNADLTDRFAALAYRWTHREIVLHTWYWVCRGLTRRLLNILYGLPYPYTAHLSPKAQIAGQPREALALIEDEFSRSDMQKSVIVFSVAGKDADQRQLFFHISDEQVLYFWLNLWTLFERGRGKTQPKAGRAMMSSPGLYQLYIRMIAILSKEFYKVSGLVKRKHKDIYFDLPEISRSNLASFIVPLFPQSPTFKEEFDRLYHILIIHW